MDQRQSECLPSLNQPTHPALADISGKGRNIGHVGVLEIHWTKSNYPLFPSIYWPFVRFGTARSILARY